MNEIDFEVINTPTLQQVKQGYRAYFRGWTVFGCIFLVAALVGTVGLSFGCKNEEIQQSVIGYLICSVLFLCLPAFLANRDYKKMRSYYGGTMPSQRLAFGIRIAIHTGDDRKYIDYDKIKKVYSCRDCYVIQHSYPGFIILIESGFTKGSFAEFKQFLRRKRPDLKIPE